MTDELEGGYVKVKVDTLKAVAVDAVKLKQHFSATTWDLIYFTIIFL